MLTQFTQSTILKQIGALRLALFFKGFDAELKASNVVLPTMDYEKDHDFPGLAAALVPAERLPDRLLKVLLTLEAAASPENHDRLRETTFRRLPCISLTGRCDLDHALELWFAAPDELAQFQNGKDAIPGVPEFELTSDLRPLISTPAVPNIKSPDHSAFKPLRTTEAPSAHSPFSLLHSALEPSPYPVDGRALLDEIAALLRRFVVLPEWGAETLGLWILHTYAFELRDVATYIGLESPARRCGKTTLLTVLCQLVNRPVVAANVSSPSFFRAIEELRPTLMIDEADRFLKGKNDLQGILNAGYNRKTAFVLRVAQQLPGSESNGQTSTLAFFSCWCPKLISQIGHLPGTLADRCIVLRMQRKTRQEVCERFRDLETDTLRRQCARFVLDHDKTLAAARPEIPEALNDRAADIWEPLLAMADLAGGPWPELARQAAVHLSTGAQDTSPIGALLLDIYFIFASLKASPDKNSSAQGTAAGPTTQPERIFTRDLVAGLNFRRDRPWGETFKGKELTELWLASQLRPFGIRPHNVWIDGVQAKGYVREDFLDIFRRYISKSELESLKAYWQPPAPSPEKNGEQPPNGSP